MSFQTTLDMVLDLVKFTLMANAPKDTGNLAYNAILRVENEIRIGGEIAPYAEKTEEYNKSSKGWINNTMESLFPIIENIIKGTMSIEKVEEMTAFMEQNVEAQFRAIAKEKERLLKE